MLPAVHAPQCPSWVWELPSQTANYPLAVVWTASLCKGCVWPQLLEDTISRAANKHHRDSNKLSTSWLHQWWDGSSTSALASSFAHLGLSHWCTQFLVQTGAVIPAYLSSTLHNTDLWRDAVPTERSMALAIPLSWDLLSPALEKSVSKNHSYEKSQFNHQSHINYESVPNSYP